MYIAPRRSKMQRHSDDRELNQARSKPDIVDWPVRTAYTFVHYYNSIQYCNIPLPPDQHHISDLAKWRWGGGLWRTRHLVRSLFLVSRVSLLALLLENTHETCRTHTQWLWDSAVNCWVKWPKLRPKNCKNQE